MTRALIIEDEPESVENLRSLLKTYCPEVEVISTGGSNADLIKLASEDSGNQYDVAFLDVMLPDGLIFQGLNQLDEIPFDIIFVTAFDKYALTAFDFSAIDYVLKPIEPVDLQRAVSRISLNKSGRTTKERLEVLQQNYAPNTTNPFEKIGISAVEGIHFIRLTDIVRLEAEDNYTHFFVVSGEKITTAKTIKTYEDVLTRFNFLRVHKKNIVNMNYMKKFSKDEGYLELENLEKIEVSRRKRPVIMDAMRRMYGDV
jgi:two-component system, LytTR family, response regulator